MKKIKKIKIKINGKFSTINENLSLSIFLKKLKIPLKKVAIEVNQEIIAVSYTHLRAHET